MKNNKDACRSRVKSQRHRGIPIRCCKSRTKSILHSYQLGSIIIAECKQNERSLYAFPGIKKHTPRSPYASTSRGDPSPAFHDPGVYPYTRTGIGSEPCEIPSPDQGPTSVDAEIPRSSHSRGQGMIVVDANVIAYRFIVGEKTGLACQVQEKDADWVVPALWRHEFLNVLATAARAGYH